MLPILFVWLVAAAVVCAAAYALLGSPQTRKGQKRRQEIISGFCLAGGILLGMLLVGTLVAGTGVAFFGRESSRFSSRPLAFVLSAASLGVIALMAQRWAKYFAGWIGYSALNALLMASSGHLRNNPAIPVPRSVALTMAALLLVSAVVCLRFTKNYRLTTVDRVTLIIWVLGFAVAANVQEYGLAAISVGCAGLVLAWLYHRSLGRRYSIEHRHAVIETR